MALLFAWFMQKRYFFSCTLKDLQYIVVSVGQKILHCIWIVLVFDLVWDKVKSNSWPMYNILLILFQICTKMYSGGHTYLIFIFARIRIIKQLIQDISITEWTETDFGFSNLSAALITKYVISLVEIIQFQTFIWWSGAFSR